VVGVPATEPSESVPAAADTVAGEATGGAAPPARPYWLSTSRLVEAITVPLGLLCWIASIV
jgi:hypothetical protein